MPKTTSAKHGAEDQHTSEATEKIVSQLHEVAEGLQDIVEEVEIGSDQSKGTNTPKAEGDQATQTPVEQKEAKPKQAASEQEKTNPDIKQADNTAPQTEPNTKDVSSQAQISPDVTKQPLQPMTEKKAIFNPFGFLKKRPKDTEAAKTKTKGLPKGVKIALIICFALIGLTGAAAGAAFLLAKPVIDNGKQTMVLAQEAYDLLKQQDLVKAGPKLAQTKSKLIDTQKSYQKLKFLGVVPVVSTYQKDGEAGLKAAVAGVEAGELFIQAVLPYADVLGFTGQESTQSGTVEDRIVRIIETLDKVSPQLDEIGQKLVIVDSEMRTINPADYPETFRGRDVRAKLVKAEALIAEAKKALTDAQPLVKVLPSILGYPEGKKYLVLFQNDGELRPTGGFMSAFAILNLDKGRVTSEKSDDIYGLDNKFNKAIVPPAPIVKHLNEKKWFLRNMNFSPDYKVSMDIFKQNYDSLKDEYKIDGIIAIDTQVLERIVEVTGPLQVPEWGTFTVENDKRCNLPQIICEIEHIVDRPLATLVTNRKATILGPMMKALLDKSMGGGKEQLSRLIPLAFELMEQKHVLVYFNDEEQQKAAEAFNIAGRIVDYDGDYLHVNNANLGGAKSNFYVDETVEQEATIEADGTVNKKVILSYKHTEPGDNCNLEAGQLCLSGILRSYFRVYVPKGSVLKTGRGSMVEVTSGEEFGKTYFEGFYELRPQSQVKIELEYTVPYKANGEYAVLIQKQAGVKNSQQTLTVNGKSETFELKKDTEKRVKL